MPHNSALVAAALVGGLALSACSAGEAPAARPSVVRPTPAASVGPSTGTGTSNELTAARAAVPKAARAHTKAGAQAFAEFFFNQINKAWMKPEPELIRPYTTKNCKSCANYVARAERLKRDSQRFDSEPATLLSAAWLPESKPDKVIVSLAIAFNSVRLVDSQGNTIMQDTKMSGLQELDVVWASGYWEVDAVHRVVIEQ